jgi:hypothetical protein
VCSERVDRRTAAGWAGAPSGGLPEREGARWRKPKPARDTSVRSEPSKSLGIYLIPALSYTAVTLQLRERPDYRTVSIMEQPDRGDAAFAGTSGSRETTQNLGPVSLRG